MIKDLGIDSLTCGQDKKVLREAAQGLNQARPRLKGKQKLYTYKIIK